MIISLKSKQKKSSISGSKYKAESRYKGCSQNGHSVNDKTETRIHIPNTQSSARPTKPFGFFFENTEFSQNKTQTITNRCFRWSVFIFVFIQCSFLLLLQKQKVDKRVFQGDPATELNFTFSLVVNKFSLRQRSTRKIGYACS